MDTSKTWHYIGTASSDPCPGLSDSWFVNLARTSDGNFHCLLTSPQQEMEADEDEDEDEDEDDFLDDDDDEFLLGDAEEAARWIKSESGLYDELAIVQKLEKIPGFEVVARWLLGKGEDEDEDENPDE